MPAQDGRTGIRRRVQEGQASWARTCTPLARRRTSAATSNGHPAQRLPPKVTPGRLRGNLRSIWLRSEEHTSELQSIMRISYAVFCLKKKRQHTNTHTD